MIYIVIPVFNRKELTRKCLVSLFEQTYKNFKVIVVDDGSNDGTGEMLKADFREAIILNGDGNLWWAGATNAGVTYALENSSSASSDFVLTLNNDLEAPADYLEKLHAFGCETSKGLIGSVSLEYNNTNIISFCGVKWNSFWAKQSPIAQKFEYSYKNLLNFNECIESDFLSGRGTLIPLSLFKEIGLYDNANFPQYAADDDFSLRAKRYGYKLLIKPDIFIKSHTGETGVSLKKVHYDYEYFKDLFFSIKSPLNLKIRYRFAIKNSRYKVLYFLMDLSRICVSFLIKFLSAGMKKRAV